MRRWRQLGSAHMEAAQASGRPQPHLTPGLAAPLADVGLSLSLDERAAAHWLIHEQAAPTFAAGGTAPGGMRVGAPEEAPGMRDTPWRCLDKTHAASCNSCMPAPAPHAAHLYCLRGRDGRPSERRLRALLEATPEWSTVPPTLAGGLDADEDDTAAMESRSTSSQHRRPPIDSSAVRQRNLLLLAYELRYQSDCWTECAAMDAGAVGLRRGSRRRSAPADQPGEEDLQGRPKYAMLVVQHQQLQQHFAFSALFDRTFTCTVHEQVKAAMMPHIIAAGRALAGPLSAVQYGRVRGQGMTWLRVRSIEGALEVARWLASVCDLRLQALQTWRDALDQTDGCKLAYMVKGAYTAPDSELDALSYVFCQSRTATECVAELLQQRDGVLKPQDSAWLQDYYDGHNSVIAMINVARAQMAMVRMEPLRTYTAAAVAVLESLCVSMQTTVAALAQRLDWITEAAVSQGDAAGDKAAALKTTPQMLLRLRLTTDCARLLELALTPPPPGQPPPRFVLVAAS